MGCKVEGPAAAGPFAVSCDAHPVECAAMQPIQSGSRQLDPRIRLASAGAAGALILMRIVWSPRNLADIGPIAIRDTTLTLALWMLILALSLVLGLRLMRGLSPPQTMGMESHVFGFALGIGSLGYIALALGLAGLLSRGAIIVVLIGLSWWLAPELHDLGRGIRKIPRRVKAWWKTSPTSEHAIALLAGSIALVGLINALSPPWDYDGLMYHLVGPKMALEAGRLLPDTDNWYINGPFTMEMVFALGMAFGDDIFPKLIHFSMGILLVAATFVVGRRWLSLKEAWIATAVLLSVPILPVLASFAYIDLGWSAFEFLAMGAVWIWWRGRSRRWLALGGLLMGFALGSKYLALPGLALLALFVVLATRKKGWRAIILSGFSFVGPAALVGIPWYLKNWMWLGNPIYPFFFGGGGWSAERLDLYTSFLDSFGTGRDARDYMLLPVNIFMHHERFGAVLNRINIPSVLFPLALLVPFRRDHPVMLAMIALAVGRFGLWSLGSQQIRFLLPVYPAYALAVAFVIFRILGDSESRPRVLSSLQALAVGLMIVPLFYALSIGWSTRALHVLLGFETKQAFLERNVTAFVALSDVSERQATAAVLLLGDGRGYYCAPNCLPDPDHFRWAAALGPLRTCQDLSGWMLRNRVSHILMNWQDLDFLLQHDPSGSLRQATEVVTRAVHEGCLQVASEGADSTLYELVRR